MWRKIIPSYSKSIRLMWCQDHDNSKGANRFLVLVSKTLNAYMLKGMSIQTNYNSIHGLLLFYLILFYVYFTFWHELLCKISANIWNFKSRTCCSMAYQDIYRCENESKSWYYGLLLNNCLTAQENKNPLMKNKSLLSAKFFYSFDILLIFLLETILNM